MNTDTTIDQQIRVTVNNVHPEIQTQSLVI